MSDDSHFTTLPDGTVLHSPPNDIRRIEVLWAFVSVDEGEGEGLCAMTLDGMMWPFIAADEERLAFLIPKARELAVLLNKRVKLIKLTTREEVPF